MTSLLTWMLILPVLGALGCLIAPSKQAARAIALATTIATLVVNIALAVGYAHQGWSGVLDNQPLSWISSINAYYHVGVDGLSLPLTLLTTGLSVLVVIAGWKVDKAAKAYHALYLLLLAGMIGVFIAMDLFLFYVFFEVSLLPMYFLIGIWGGPRKEYAAIKFFLYTLAGSICLLIVMLGIYFYSPAATHGAGNTWDMVTLQSKAVRDLFGRGGKFATFGMWAFWLTLIAFMIKLPGVPFHTWLPDAHVEAPTPISMVLAGVLLKMGGYAIMRITYPFFPDWGQYFWVCVAGLGVAAILYGALCAMAQSDWKKLVAYSSVSHMGYVTLGIAVLTREGFDGAYFQMIAHGITSAMMFFLVGVVYDRAHHREINRLGGLWLKYPGYGGWSLVGFFAGMGLPLLCGFIGEILVLLGTFRAAGNAVLMHGAATHTLLQVQHWSLAFGILAAFAVVLTAGYILWMFQRVYMGPQKPEYAHYEAVSAREYLIMATLGIAAVVFGVAPILVFAVTTPTFNHLAHILGMA